ncbi:hypothetical protein UFOVP577_37 [uncultured Caudovirales phage]|uniref:Uncharacterized protein n=1 Tax=uncultured Caudovirales phage TaxID=2100421 RepID=A0A6J5MVV8_9CAUD|nr:hypothetical protein UFOVP577_37 [uncultured Caudovirales phage]
MIGTIGVLLDDESKRPELWIVTDCFGTNAVNWIEVSALLDRSIIQTVPVAEFWPLA